MAVTGPQADPLFGKLFMAVGQKKMTFARAKELCGDRAGEFEKFCAENTNLMRQKQLAAQRIQQLEAQKREQQADLHKLEDDLEQSRASTATTVKSFI